jgi:hypothetical protein
MHTTWALPKTVGVVGLDRRVGLPAQHFSVEMDFDARAMHTT